jgi:hypothetical protein
MSLSSANACTGTSSTIEGLSLFQCPQQYKCYVVGAAGIWYGPDDTIGSKALSIRIEHVLKYQVPELQVLEYESQISTTAVANGTLELS